ncbi:MAG: hypothetical protein RR812_07495 [Vagococcus sp.]
MNLTAVSTAVTTALTSVGAEVTANIGKIAPIALGIVGALMVISFAVKTFRSIAN